VLFCKERETYLTFPIKLQNGHFGKKFWAKKFDIVSILMIECDSSTASQIRTFPYDTTTGVNLGTLKLYRKGKLVFQKTLMPRNYAMDWQHKFGIANTGYDVLKADSLEIVNGSELLNGLEAEFIQFNKCMCWRNPAPNLKFMSHTAAFYPTVAPTLSTKGFSSFPQDLPPQCPPLPHLRPNPSAPFPKASPSRAASSHIARNLWKKS
jgi:hypothetical protein